MRTTIIPALAAALLAVACHPHGGPSLAASSADRVPVVLDGVVLSSVASANRGQSGGRLTGAAAGTAISAFLPPEMLARLPQGARPHLELAVIRSHSAAPGTRVVWSLPGSDVVGTVVPGVAEHTADGLCREVVHEVTADGQAYGAQARACRHPDGTWSRVE